MLKVAQLQSVNQNSKAGYQTKDEDLPQTSDYLTMSISENQSIEQSLLRSEEIWNDFFQYQVEGGMAFKEMMKEQEKPEEQDYRLKEKKYPKLTLDWVRISDLVQGTAYAGIVSNIIRNSGLNLTKHDHIVVAQLFDQKIRVDNNEKCFSDDVIKQWTKKEILRMLRADYIERCKEMDVDVILGIFVVDNGKKLRFVFNGAAGNIKYMPPSFLLPSQTTPLTYTSLKYFAKSDITSAFYVIPLAEQMRRQFGFQFEGSFYRYKCLPFGWSCSPYYFTCTYSAILHGLWQEVHGLKEIKDEQYQQCDYQYIQYIDDVLYMGVDARITNLVKCFMENRLRELGFIIAQEKDVEASLKVEWLGFELQQGCLQLTEKGRNRLSKAIEEALFNTQKNNYQMMKRKPDYSVNDHLHLLGIMGQFAQICPNARGLYLELMRSVNPEVRKQSAWENQKRAYQIGALEMINLEKIKNCLFEFPGFKILIYPRSKEMFTDAAKQGLLCTLGVCDKYCQDLTPERTEHFYKQCKGFYFDLHDPLFQKDYQPELDMIHDEDIQSDGLPTIYVLEALGVVVAVKNILKFSKITEQNLINYCDNQIVVRAFNDQFSRSPTLEKYIRYVQTLCQKRLINFVVRYIPTKQNPADAFSRCNRSNGDWATCFSPARFPVKAYEIVKTGEKEEILVLSHFDNVIQQLGDKKRAIQAWFEHKQYILNNILSLMGPKLIMIAKLLIGLAMRTRKNSFRLDNDPMFRMIIGALRSYNLFNDTLYDKYVSRGEVTEADIEQILSPNFTAFELDYRNAVIHDVSFPELRNMNNFALQKRKRNLNNFCQIKVSREDSDDFEGGDSSPSGSKFQNFCYYMGKSQAGSNKNQIKNAYHQSKAPSSSKNQTILSLPDDNYFKKKALSKHKPALQVVPSSQASVLLDNSPFLEIDFTNLGFVSKNKKQEVLPEPQTDSPRIVPFVPISLQSQNVTPHSREIFALEQKIQNLETELYWSQLNHKEVRKVAVEFKGKFERLSKEQASHVEDTKVLVYTLEKTIENLTTDLRNTQASFSQSQLSFTQEKQALNSQLAAVQDQVLELSRSNSRSSFNDHEVNAFSSSDPKPKPDGASQRIRRTAQNPYVEPEQPGLFHRFTNSIFAYNKQDKTFNSDNDEEDPEDFPQMKSNHNSHYPSDDDDSYFRNRSSCRSDIPPEFDPSLYILKSVYSAYQAEASSYQAELLLTIAAQKTHISEAQEQLSVFNTSYQASQQSLKVKDVMISDLKQKLLDLATKHASDQQGLKTLVDSAKRDASSNQQTLFDQFNSQYLELQNANHSLLEESRQLKASIRDLNDKGIYVEAERDELKNQVNDLYANLQQDLNEKNQNPSLQLKKLFLTSLKDFKRERLLQLELFDHDFISLQHEKDVEFDGLYFDFEIPVDVQYNSFDQLSLNLQDLMASILFDYSTAVHHAINSIHKGIAYDPAQVRDPSQARIRLINESDVQDRTSGTWYSTLPLGARLLLELDFFTNSNYTLCNAIQLLDCEMVIQATAMNLLATKNSPEFHAFKVKWTGPLLIQHVNRITESIWQITGVFTSYMKMRQGCELKLKKRIWEHTFWLLTLQVLSVSDSEPYRQVLVGDNKERLLNLIRIGENITVGQRGHEDRKKTGRMWKLPEILQEYLNKEIQRTGLCLTQENCIPFIPQQGKVVENPRLTKKKFESHYQLAQSEPDKDQASDNDIQPQELQMGLDQDSLKLKCERVTTSNKDQGIKMKRAKTSQGYERRLQKGLLKLKEAINNKEVGLQSSHLVLC